MQNPYIKQLLLVEVDDMVEPSQRYMSMNIDNEMIQQLIDVYEDGGTIDRHSIARTVGRSMSLSDHCFTPTVGRHKDKINIRRFRFFLHVIDTEASRAAPGKSFLITGFSDEIDSADLDDLRPDCDMYVNSIVELRSYLSQGRRDVEEKFSISKMSAVHRKDHGRRSHHNGRVTDILTFCSMAEANEIDLHNAFTNSEDDDVIQTGAMFGKRVARGTSLGDLSRNNYLSRLISAEKSGMADSKSYNDNELDSDDDSFGVRRMNLSASRYSDTPDFERGNSFVMWMKSRNMKFSNDMIFKYEDLIDMVDVRSPDFDNLCDNTDIMPIDGNALTYVSKEFYGRSSKMQSIAIMSQEIPTFMSECLMTRIHFTIDNKYLNDGLPEYSVDDFSMIVRMDGEEEMIDVFMRRYIDEVYMHITNDNARYMRLEVICNFGGQVEIFMEYEGAEEEVFRFPAFMSGLLSNNTSFDLEDTYKLAAQYTSISKDFIERTVFGEDDDRDDLSNSTRMRRIEDAFK